MRVLLTAYGSRGDVEPLMALASELRDLGGEVRMCTPPDFAELFDSAGLPLTPIGEPVRPFVKGVLAGTTKAPAEGLPARAAAMTATTYEAVVTAAEQCGGCDVIVATGLLPAAAGARATAVARAIRTDGAALAAKLLLAASRHHDRPRQETREQPGDAAT
jgi:vancomycin aglycone glucosyltransferase